MDEPVRGRFASFSDDDDEPSLRASLSSRSDEDEFPQHLPQEDDIRKFPPRISTEDDGFRKGSEGTPRSGSVSPLLQSFAALSTQSAFSFSPESLGSSQATSAGDRPSSSHVLLPTLDEPTTPQRPTKAPLCESQNYIFADSFTRVTPSSQVRKNYRSEPKSSRILAETPARKSVPKHARNPCPVSSHSSSPPPLSSSSKRTPVKGKVNNESRLKVPSKNESPVRPDSWKSPLPASADCLLAQAASASNSVSDGFTLKPSREVSPPARLPPKYTNRRFSIGGELLPSPARSWLEPHDRKEAVAAHEHRTSPAVFEPKHTLTPNEPKSMILPSRPRKRSGISVANRCLLSSPMVPPPCVPSIDDVPDLLSEACPMAISNSVANTARESKIARRHSAVTPGSTLVRSALEASPTHKRSESSPVVVRHSSMTYVPEAAPATSLKQSPEDEKLERIRCRNLTGVMVRHGMKLLCLDWDLTVVACHTKSHWYGSAQQLEQWIRPVFRNLIWAALQTTLHVAFVSFSGQADFINDALRIAFGPRAQQFVVRCSDKKWGLEDGVFAGMFPRAKQNDASKLSHICSAATFFNKGDKENLNPQKPNIQPRDIVLIDDDQDNIRDAGKHDVHSVHMDTDNPRKFLTRLEEFFGIGVPAAVSLHMSD